MANHSSLSFSIPVRIVAVVAIAFSLISCSSKSAECTKLISAIGEGQTLVVNLTPQGDAITTQKLSQQLNQISQDIETLKIQDKPLQTIQKKATQQFRDLSNSLKQLGETLTTAEKVSITPEGKQQLLQAQKTVQEIGEKAKQTASQNEALFKELVNYCPKKET